MVYGSVDGTKYYIFVGDDDYIYYDNGGTITQTSIAEGEATLLLYNDQCLVLDGSYIKRFTTTGLEIVYDDGDGASGYQYHWSTVGEDVLVSGIPIFFALSYSTVTRIAQGFTTQNWDSGYTIPPTTVSGWFTRIGDGYAGTDNESVYVHIRKRSDGSSIASKVIVPYPIEDNLPQYPAVATEFVVTFESSDITSELEPDTDYYLSFEYDNGDNSNYIQVHGVLDFDGVTGYDADHLVYSWDSGTTTWYAGSGPTYLKAYIKPGRPPKGSFGVVHNNRPFIAGDPDNPGYVWFGNLTHLDWSTENGGGYVSTVDDNRNSYEVGAMQTLYNQLFVFGVQDAPFLTRLIGDSPSQYSLPNTYQNVWSADKAIVATPNDIFFANKDEIGNLSGVELYGDMRTAPIANPIKNIIDSYWDDGALLVYHPDDNQIWLQLPGCSRIQVCCIGQKVGYGSSVRYPWVEYSFPFIPTFLKYINGAMYFGDTHSRIYKLSNSSTQYKDIYDPSGGQIIGITFSVKSGVITPHIDATIIDRISIVAATSGGVSFDLFLYNESSTSPQLALSLDLSDGIGAWQTLTNDDKNLDNWITLIGYSWQIGISTVILSGLKTTFGKIECYIRPLNM
jgi:hypothetical protein